MVIDVKAISGAIFRASDCYSNWKRGRSGPEKHILFFFNIFYVRVFIFLFEVYILNDYFLLNKKK